MTTDLPWYMVLLFSAAVGLVAFAAGRSAGWREGRDGAMREGTEGRESS